VAEQPTAGADLNLHFLSFSGLAANASLFNTLADCRLPAQPPKFPENPFFAPVFGVLS
jgi:hypothetical protein